MAEEVKIVNDSIESLASKVLRRRLKTSNLWNKSLVLENCNLSLKNPWKVLEICLGLSLRGGGRGFSPATKRVAPGYSYWKIEAKIEPKEIPSRLIPCLLVVFTRRLEILLTTLFVCLNHSCMSHVWPWPYLWEASTLNGHCTTLAEPQLNLCGFYLFICLSWIDLFTDAVAILN